MLAKTQVDLVWALRHSSSATQPCRDARAAGHASVRCTDAGIHHNVVVPNRRNHGRRDRSGWASFAANDCSVAAALGGEPRALDSRARGPSVKRVRVSPGKFVTVLTGVAAKAARVFSSGAFTRGQAQEMAAAEATRVSSGGLLGPRRTWPSKSAMRSRPAVLAELIRAGQCAERSGLRRDPALN